MTKYDFITYLESTGYKLQFASLCGKANNLQKYYRYGNGKLIINVKILADN
jgi:hypothetical protein